MKKIPYLTSTNWYLCLWRAINSTDKAKEARLHRKEKYKARGLQNNRQKKALISRTGETMR